MNFDEAETIPTYQISKMCNWKDMFPSLININNQTVDFDIFTILHGMGLEQYTYIFQGIKLTEFLMLTENDLYHLGMDIKVHRIQFMECLHKFHRKKWSIQSIGIINKSLPYTYVIYFIIILKI